MDASRCVWVCVVWVSMRCVCCAVDTQRVGAGQTSERNVCLCVELSKLQMSTAWLRGRTPGLLSNGSQIMPRRRPRGDVCMWETQNSCWKGQDISHGCTAEMEADKWRTERNSVSEEKRWKVMSKSRLNLSLLAPISFFHYKRLFTVYSDAFPLVVLAFPGCFIFYLTFS